MAVGSLVAAALAVAAPSTALPPVTIAPRGTVEFDMQCMLAGQAAANQLKPPVRDQVGGLMMYYFGRVDSAVSGGAAKERLRRVIATLRDHNLAPLMPACGQFMTQHGAAMEATKRSVMGGQPPKK